MVPIPYANAQYTTPLANKPLKALLPVPLFLLSLPSQQRIHFNPIRSNDRLDIAWQRRLHIGVCQRRMYGMCIMRNVFLQIIGFCLVIPTENRTFAADYRRVICGIPGFLLLFTDKSIFYAISLAAYNKETIGNTSVHTSVCTAFASVSLGYARHPA